MPNRADRRKPLQGAYRSARQEDQVIPDAPNGITVPIPPAGILPSTDISQPWYESGLLWGAFGLAVGIVLVVVAAMVRDLRCLLWAAWPLFCLSGWAACRGIERPRRRWLITVSLSIVIGVGLLWGHEKLSPHIGVPTIRPTEQFPLYSDGWTRVTPVLIDNNNDSPTYGVQVKITTVSFQRIPAREIVIEPDVNPDPVNIRMGDISVLADVAMFDFVDRNNQESVIIQFYELTPHQTRRLMVSTTSKVDSQARASFIQVSKKPPALSRRNDNNIAVEFVSPGDGTLKGVHMAMRRIE